MNNTAIKMITINYLNQKYDQFHKIYTDGSKTANACGIGIWHEQKNGKNQM